MTRRARPIFVLLVTAFVTLAACGSPGGEAASDGHGAGPDNPVPSPDDECGEHATGDGPDDSVSYTPCPGDDAGPPGSGAQRVEPQPGQEDVRPVPFEKVTGTGRKLRVFFWSGVEPCNVLDRVALEETPKRITITLYEGHAPADEDVACIELGVRKVTVVTLGAPRGDRKVADGAP